jgi:hypothetical protein
MRLIFFLGTFSVERDQWLSSGSQVSMLSEPRAGEHYTESSRASSPRRLDRAPAGRRGAQDVDGVDDLTRDF